MNLTKVISQFISQTKSIVGLVSNLTDEEVHWKPDPESWSILEVMYHLVYEEIYDFRHHIGRIYGSGPSYQTNETSEEWKTQHVNSGFKELLDELQSEREKSITWITTLDNADWNETIDFPWGDLRAGDLLASWLAHDLLHLRQFIELRYTYIELNHSPYFVKYAGKW